MRWEELGRQGVRDKGIKVEVDGGGKARLEARIEREQVMCAQHLTQHLLHSTLEGVSPPCPHPFPSPALNSDSQP